MSLDKLLPLLLQGLKFLLRIRPKAILAIDDNAIDREQLRETIEACGFRCDTAASAEIALGMIRLKNYKAVFSDWGLTGMSGWELLQRVKAHDESIRRILVVGSPMSLAGLKAGTALMLATKPLDEANVRELMSL